MESGVIEAMVNARLLEIPPPGDGLSTATNTEPDDEKSAAGIVAVIFVLPTKFVLNWEPPHSTVLPEMKPDPLTVSVKPPFPIGALTGDMELMLGVGFCTTGDGEVDEIKDEAEGLVPPQFVRNAANIAMP